jgi:hypothetical protein
VSPEIASIFIPAVNITVEEVSIWIESDTDVINKINNVYSNGDDVYGFNDGLKTLESGATPTTYTTGMPTVTAVPAGWTDPPFPA